MRRSLSIWPVCPLIALMLAVLAPAVEGQDDEYWDPYYDSGNGGGSSSGGGQRGLFGPSEFSYGYFDFGYFKHNFEDDRISDADGLGGVLSIPLMDSLYIKGALGFASGETDLGADLDYLAWEIGAGIGLPITSGLDFVIEGGLARRKLDGDVFDDFFDGYGYYATPGLRLALGELIELNGGVTFRNIDSDSDISVDLRALLHLTPGISLWGSAILAEEENQYGVGLRLSF